MTVHRPHDTGVTRCTIGAQLERAARRECANTRPGLTPDQTNPDRRCDGIMMPDTHSTQLPPPCPRCGRPAENSYANERDGVVEAGYVCDRAHGWTTRWYAGGAA